MEKTETKFNEIVSRTSSLEEMKNNFLAERVLRGWNEDFIDEDTGEVVTIQRNEILFDKGLFIDSDTLTEINFYLQSGDVKDVLISNQKRTGNAVESETSIYSVTIQFGTKKRTYYLYANSIELAIKIMTDFLEQKIIGRFTFTSIKEIGYSTLIPTLEEDLEKDFYKIEVDISFDDDEPFTQVFILQAKDAENAKEIIIKFIHLKMKSEKNERVFETIIVSAKTISCHNIIDFNFSKEYFDNK